MAGALLGTDHPIAFLLHHFWLLYPAVILFSGVELIAGAALMAGLITRLAALVSVAFSIVLVLLFGWEGPPASRGLLCAPCRSLSRSSLFSRKRTSTRAMFLRELWVGSCLADMNGWPRQPRSPPFRLCAA
jgi:hypothetical protein